MNLAKTLRRFENVARLFIFGLPKYAIGSIDVTNRCNLRCEHCYFFAEDHDNEKELSIEGWVAKLEEMKAAGHPMMLCTWVGGEPMMRKNTDRSWAEVFQTQHHRHQWYGGAS